MTCFYCGTELENGVTAHSGGKVIIENVPCKKCPQCCEVIYSSDVAERIEEIIERCKDAAEVAIVNYKAA